MHIKQKGEVVKTLSLEFEAKGSSLSLWSGKDPFRVDTQGVILTHSANGTPTGAHQLLSKWMQGCQGLCLGHRMQVVVGSACAQSASQSLCMYDCLL